MDKAVTEDRVCEDCLFWEEWSEEVLREQRVPPGISMGQCRRYPPVRVTRDRSEFPTTGSRVFCGEWKEYDHS
jgi:hypothetical protein